jgi:hypothetical protein
MTTASALGRRCKPVAKGGVAEEQVFLLNAFALRATGVVLPPTVRKAFPDPPVDFRRGVTDYR